MCNLVRSPGPNIATFLSEYPMDFITTAPRMINAFGRPKLPIMLADGSIVMAEWTFAPPAAPGRETEDSWRKLTYNARSEEMFEKRTFKSAAVEQHGLLPVSGYYEHQHRGKARIAYWLTRPDDQVMFLAILYHFYEKEGIYRFAVCTMPPTPLTAWVHNSRPRQPLDIFWAARQAWFRASDPASVAPFIVPNENDGITAEATEGINGQRVLNAPPPPPFGLPPVPQGDLS